MSSTEQTTKSRKERRRHRPKRRETGDTPNITSSATHSQAQSRAQSPLPKENPNFAGPSNRILSKSLAVLRDSKSQMNGRQDREKNGASGSQNKAHSNSRVGSPKASTNGIHGDFAAGDDFIAFGVSDHEEEGGGEPFPSSSFDLKGKRREAAPLEPHSGEKRSIDQMRFNEEDGYTNKKQRMDAASRLTPWVNDVDWESCRNMAEMMHKEVKAFVNYISPTPEEHEVRGMVIATIARAIRSNWEDATISAFGSYETKLYLPLGDIDLVVESRSMEGYDKRRVLYSLAQSLRKAGITDNVQVIAKAKVPIIKFVTSHGRFAVDISLNQTNGIQAGRVVNRLLQQMPALQPLIMIIKLFLSQRSMNEVYTGGLGSYAIVCMVVSFLQMHPKIRAGEIDPNENLGVLIMEFFEFYGHHFNYEHTGISLRDGGTYFSKIARGWDDPKNTALLSIEDPLDISNDISKNSYNMSRVRKTLAGAHEVLTAAAFMRCRVLSAKMSGEYMDLRGSAHRSREYDNQSILASVMGVTQETLNHRRMVKQLYDRGTLQNILGIPRQPPPPPVNSPPPLPPSSNGVSRRAVESAWDEADIDMDYSESDAPSHHSLSDGQEESRYTTHNPRKQQRRTNANGKNHDTLYVAASDEDDSDEPQIAVHLATGSEGLIKPTKTPVDLEKIEARRAYWASKGLPGGGMEDSDY